jgi:hypothetical protein
MDLKPAIEKNHGALRRIVATLVALAAMAGSKASDPRSGSVGKTTLPRHLHRFVLSLLRPAEAAVRRLIIVAARGVELPKPRESRIEHNTSKGIPDSPSQRAVPERALLRLRHGLPVEFLCGEPILPWAREAPAKPASLPQAPAFPMFDPIRRLDSNPVRERRILEAPIPRIALSGGGDDLTPAIRPPPAPDDRLDASRLLRRLDAIHAALDDLPRQARRFAHWQARRDAMLAAECGAGARDEDGLAWGKPGASEEALALYSRSTLPGRPIRPNITERAKSRRLSRGEPLRPGRPPGWRKKPSFEIQDVPKEVHGLAVWARDGPR